MARRFPMIDFDGIDVGLYEPGFRSADGAALGADAGRPLRPAMAAPIVKGCGRPPAGNGDRLDERSTLAIGRTHQRRPLRLRARPVAAQAVSRRDRPADPADPPGSLLLRAAGRRPPLPRPAPCPVGPISTAATCSTASPISRAAASSSRMTCTASEVDPDTQDRRPTRGRARRGHRLSRPPLPALQRRAADRGASLPI